MVDGIFHGVLEEETKRYLMEADGDVGIIVEKVVEILYREGGKACSRQ